MEELSKFLGRDASGLSKLANRLERKCIQVPSLAIEIDILRKSIHAQYCQMSECQA
jgi:hypothetical protein